MPERGARLRNAMPMFILQSPLNPIMSGKYTILEFTGRKTGKQYRTPVAYVREDDLILLSTDSPWWRNLRGGAPVNMIMKGSRVAGVGRTISDPKRGAEILRTLVDAIPSYAGPAEL
ncbi:nitroreductase family deazaflavin-dependent oxidoreductase, partial [Salmonella enterica subsp. enterica serovar Mbandaka]|nr:nitroreductase family deazaflavin-dependent oxidoreductase [Salmonella enterica subsp. enterica serovar Mbandaka]